MRKISSLLILVLSIYLFGCSTNNDSNTEQNDNSSNVINPDNNTDESTNKNDNNQSNPSNPEIEKYTIKFISNGGSTISEIKKEKDSKINEPENPEYEGMKFVCWCYDEELKNQVTWPLTLDKNYTLYAKWNVKVDIVGYLKLLLKEKEYNPYNLIPETLKPGYQDNVVSNVDYDFSKNTNVSSIVGHGFGEQWNMVLDNLNQTNIFFNALSLVETISTSSVVVFQNYFD